MAYIAPIHRPTSVRHALSSYLVSPDEESLVLAYVNRIEIWRLANETLVKMHSRVINGSISILQKLRPKDSQTDILFVGTEHFEHFTLIWNPEMSQLDTIETFRDPGEHHMRDSLSHDKCNVDPDGRYMAMHLWEGVMTIMRLKTTRTRARELEWMDQVRLSELFVKASTFLHTETGHPKIALLYKSRADASDSKLATYRLTSDDRHTQASRFDASRDRDIDIDIPDPSAAMLIPVRKVQEEVKRHNFRNVESAKAHLGGLIIVGETRLQYIDEVTKRMMESPLEYACIFVTWAEYDATHYLLADDYGMLHLLSIITEGVEVRRMKVEAIGMTSRASALVYLGDDLVFVASAYGDSQLVKLDLNLSDHKGTLEVIQTFRNIGPILDFAVMDMGNRDSESQLGNEYSSGQARIVTGSGVYKDGSLRSVRSGVGLEDIGLLGEITHTRGLFSLSSDASSKVDTLVVSSLTETRIFRFDSDGEVEEVPSFCSMAMDQQTLLAKNLPGGRLLQVTALKANLIDGDSGIVLSTWSPRRGKTITNASANDKWLLLSVEGTALVSVNLGDVLQTTQEQAIDASNQIACVHASPQFPDIGVVGFWTQGTVSIVSLATLQPLHFETLRRSKSDSSIPLDLALVRMLPNSPNPTLFIALEDGNVVTFSVALPTFALSGRKSVILGTREARFHLLPSGNGGVYSIFATTDHPSLIYGSENRIVYSAVTAEEAACVCPFDAAAYPGCIAVATDAEMKLCRIDGERQTHVRDLPMGETIRRVAYSPREKVFGLGCIRRDVVNGDEEVQSSLMLVDEVRFDRIGKAFALGVPGATELVEAVACAQMRNSYGELAERFFVGTSFLPEPGVSAGKSQGRILVFGLDRERNPCLVFEQELKGGCRALAVMEGGLVVAALTKTVVVSEYVEEEATSGRLDRLASYRPSSYPVGIAVAGRVIAVADLTRSVSLVEVVRGVNGEPTKLVEVARHFQSAWSTAVCSLGDDSFLEADGEGNLQVLWRNTKGITEDQKRRLEVTSEINLGEMVNQIRPISVETSSGALITPKAFLGTVEGGIYMFGTVASQHQEVLFAFQRKLAEVVQTEGGIEFNSYRAFRNREREGDEAFRFLDGELLERFLDVDEDTQHKICEGLGPTTEDMRNVVEDLRRMH